MVNAADAQGFGNLDEHGTVFNIKDLCGRNLGDIQSHSKDVRVGLAKMDEARGNEKIYEPIELECSNPMGCQLAPFIAHHRNLQPALRLSRRASSII